MSKTRMLGLVFAGGFRNLAPHMGGALAYFQAFQKSKVPKPIFITGSSAGAMVSVILTPWTPQSINHGTRVIGNLTRSQIFRFRKTTELLGALNLVESFGNFIYPPKQWPVSAKVTFELFKSLASLSTKGAACYEILNHPSIFSSEPLARLLWKNLGPNLAAIWDPRAVKLEIPALDLATAQMAYFTNYLPEHREAKDRDALLIKYLLASASIPAFLPPIVIDGQLKDDAAILDNAPIQRAMAAGCETIILFRQTKNHEVLTMPPEETTWIEELVRALEIAIKQHTQLKLDWHQKINQDLEVIKTLKEKIGYLKWALKSDLAKKGYETAFAHRCLECLGELEKELEKLTAFGKSPTRLIEVVSEEKIPHLNFQNFDRASLRLGMEIGYRAAEKTLAANQEFL